MGMIQRATRGLMELLSIKDISFLPKNLLQDVRPTIDLLQFYGLQDPQYITNNNAALAENGIITLSPGAGGAAAPGANLGAPFVLFAISSIIVKTATMTACQASYGVGLDVANQVGVYNTGSLAPFGATETGAVGHAFVLPYPRICAANTTINFRLDILGTDATANCSVTALVGRLT